MSLLRLLAAPLAPLYGAVVRARNRGFDAHPDRAARATVPVISIGNLSAGGTGKTPLTLYLADGLENGGWTNAVLSRGYGGRRDVDPMSVEADSDPRQTGDEPLLMARRLGPRRVVVGRKREAAALRALSQRPDSRCLLLDDGFQHRALYRDLDLLVLDGVRRWGDGRM
ncbi:MAG: tetraacyldisaccharide 4'-kinase, partial [Geothrix sp.]|uniref:tetraacyldisaccharide 4'-kinase n=1 Tax=Geothrix sp. TaxID=1962974 RepID=UPI003BAE5997